MGIEQITSVFTKDPAIIGQPGKSAFPSIRPQLEAERQKGAAQGDGTAQLNVTVRRIAD